MKSLNKHYMSDISLDVRDRLKSKEPEGWSKLVNTTAIKTSSIFPRNIASQIVVYLMSSPEYEIDGRACTKDEKRTIEDLVKFSQLIVAKQECEINEKIYSEDYASIISNIKTRLDEFDKSNEYKQAWDASSKYFMTLKKLKYLRRWNRINRMVSTNVLGHTFLVAFLSIMLSMSSSDEAKNEEHFTYRVVLRSLFHDVPESLTGDIITPVKEEIKKNAGNVLEEVEKDLQKMFVESAPSGVKEDIQQYELLKEIDNKKIFSVSSMTKDCDRLAALFECFYEKASGVLTPEIEYAYGDYIQELSRSEWSSVKDFVKTISDYKAK
jgi:putative hydrolase of HD superfamily